jgi:hypothetical protein
MHEQPLIDFYTSQGHSVHELSVDKPLDAAFNELQQVMEV